MARKPKGKKPPGKPARSRRFGRTPVAATNPKPQRVEIVITQKPPKKKWKWKRKIIPPLIAGGLFWVGLEALRYSGRKSARERAQAKALRQKAVAAFQKSRLVRSPETWVDICAIMKWDPSNRKYVNMINLVEQVSQNTNLGPAKVLSIASKSNLDPRVRSFIPTWEGEYNRWAREAASSRGLQSSRAKTKMREISARLNEAYVTMAFRDAFSQRWAAVTRQDFVLEMRKSGIQRPLQRLALEEAKRN